MRTISPKPGIKEQYLKNMSILTGANDHTISVLAEKAVLRLYEKGETIFEAGLKTRHLIWLAHGAIRVVKQTPDGREKNIHLLQGPIIVAEIPSLMDEPIPASIVCFESSTVLLIEREALLEVLSKDPEVAMHLMAGLYKRLKELTNSLANHGQTNAAGRVASYLLGITQTSDQIVLRAPKKELASYLGLQPESFSRALTKLGKLGAIEVDEANITVTNRDILKSTLEPT